MLGPHIFDYHPLLMNQLEQALAYLRCRCVQDTADRRSTAGYTQGEQSLNDGDGGGGGGGGGRGDLSAPGHEVSGPPKQTTNLSSHHTAGYH